MRKTDAAKRMLRAAFVVILPFALSTTANGGHFEPGIAEVSFGQSVNFVRGERLRLNLGGNARKVQVHLGDAAVGSIIDVPASRTVELLLPEDRRDVSKLYVQGDGPAPIVQFERIIP